MVEKIDGRVHDERLVICGTQRCWKLKLKKLDDFFLMILYDVCVCNDTIKILKLNLKKLRTQAILGTLNKEKTNQMVQKTLPVSFIGSCDDLGSTLGCFGREIIVGILFRDQISWRPNR